MAAEGFWKGSTLGTCGSVHAIVSSVGVIEVTDKYKSGEDQRSLEYCFKYLYLNRMFPPSWN